jgi:hypothetical protein
VSLALLRAIPSGAKVLFVGDVDQLPSVGPGAVFRDLILSEIIPVARLNTPHRTALNSDIVVNAHKIIQGKADEVDTAGQRDFTFLNLQDEQAQIAIVERYVEMLSRYGRDGVQVLAPTYDGVVGVTALNASLQARVNPPAMDRPEIEHHGTVFRLGDRVMQTANNKQLNVVNGEVGFITGVDLEGKGLTVNFGTKEVVLTNKALLSLDLAYAITIHKSQGSEYPGVITVCSAGASFMLDRNLIYTAVTRAKQHSEIIGDVQTFKNAVRKPGANRWTTLTNTIRALFDLPSLMPPAPVVRPRPSSPFLDAIRAGKRAPASPGPVAVKPLIPPASASGGRLSLIKQPPTGPDDLAGPFESRGALVHPTQPASATPTKPAGGAGKLSLFKRPEHDMPETDDLGFHEPSEDILGAEKTFSDSGRTTNPKLSPSRFQHH